MTADHAPRFFVSAMHKDVPGIGRMVDYWRVVDSTTGMRADGTARYETPERAQQWCDSLNATA
jgi:hypothetical protein